MLIEEKDIKEIWVYW